MADSYLTIEKYTEAIYKEKGSKFLAFAYPVTTQDEIKQILADLRKKYYDATHHCYAYILGFDKEEFRMNDDGEPSSTAGKPIYGQLLSNNLTNVLVVVVRYFGGTKLGVSGLIKAYKSSTQVCLESAVIVEKKVMRFYKITFAYDKMNAVMSFLKQINAQQKHHSFDMECSIEVLINEENSNKFEEEISKAGIKTDVVSPKLLPNYTKQKSI